MYDAIPEDQLREWKKDFEEDIKGLHVRFRVSVRLLMMVVLLCL